MKEKAETRIGQWSDRGLGSALREEFEKDESQPWEMKARSRRSRVGEALPLDQVKDRFKSGKSNRPILLTTSRKRRISETLEGTPFLSYREKSTLKSPTTSHTSGAASLIALSSKKSPALREAQVGP